MRNRPDGAVTRMGLRTATTLLLTAVVAVCGAAPALASTQAQAAGGAPQWSMLGSVGVVAVVFGLLGMIAGVARKRRRRMAMIVAERRRLAAERQAAAEREVYIPEPDRGVDVYVPAPSVPEESEQTVELPESHAA